MKVKILLKFYFNAAPINDWLDRLITYNACKAAESTGFDKITSLIEDKRKLCNLMNYLEDKFGKLTQRDKAALKCYADLRVGVRNLCDENRREIKRAVMKFTRLLTFIGRHLPEVQVLQKYRAVL